MRFAFLMLVAAVATVNAASPSGPRVLLHGWDFLETTPEDILDNAASFAKLPIDGVMVTLPPTKQADGTSIGSLSLPQDVAWQYESLAKYEPTLKAICAGESLHDSMLLCAWFYTKGPRFSLLDDAAWARIGRNMGVVGRLSRETGLKGINSDPEDYHGQNQYKPAEGEPPYDELVKIVRRRGREVFGPLFREQPEARVLFYWFLTFEKAYFNVSDPRALARERQDLWPAFADGIMDVLPPTARIIDGDEHAYSSDYVTRDFHVSACNQRQLASWLLSPENRMKHASQVQVSFGLYLDMYVNHGPAWYMGPVAGSRVEHFRRNYADAFKLADEYVWLWGERLPTVHWENATVNPSVNVEKTWAEALPGLYRPMLALHDADYGLRRRKAELAKAGRLREMNSNPTCRPDAASRNANLPRPYDVYTGKGKPEFRLVDGVGDGDASCLAVKNSKDGAILTGFGNIDVGEAYAVSCRMKGGEPKAYLGWKDSDGNWKWGLGTVWLKFSPPDAAGWCTGEALAEVPMGAKGFAFALSPNMKEGETVLIDNVHIWKLW